MGFNPEMAVVVRPTATTNKQRPCSLSNMMLGMK
jgi:hypothetical protein